MNLKEYLDKNGIHNRWFAKKIGLGQSYLCDVLNNRKSLPNKYWNDIVLHTRGEVTLQDLLDSYNHHYESIKTHVDRRTKEYRDSKKKMALVNSDSGELSKGKKTE